MQFARPNRTETDKVAGIRPRPTSYLFSVPNENKQRSAARSRFSRNKWSTKQKTVIRVYRNRMNWDQMSFVRELWISVPANLIIIIIGHFANDIGHSIPL